MKIFYIIIAIFISLICKNINSAKEAVVNDDKTEVVTVIEPEIETTTVKELETEVETTSVVIIETVPETTTEKMTSPTVEETKPVQTEAITEIVTEPKTEFVTEPVRELTFEEREQQGLLTREEIVNKVLEGFNYARTHADSNRFGKAFKPVTINETYSKYAQYFAEWLSVNDPTIASVDSHSGTALGWDPFCEGLSLTPYDVYEEGKYQVDHIMYYGDEGNLQIGIGAVYKDGYYYIVIQSWEHMEKYYPF